MSNEPRFKEAYPFQKDVLALPVTDLDATSEWYSTHFSMVEVERTVQPVPKVILERFSRAHLAAERVADFHGVPK